MKERLPGARLADAQRVLAEEYGFASWGALQAEVTRRASGPLGQRIRGRRSLAALFRSEQHPSRGGRQVTAAALRRGRRLWRPLADELDGSSPVPSMRAGLIVQVGFLIAALIGVGVVCVALHEAAVPYRSDHGRGPSRLELIHKAI